MTLNSRDINHLLSLDVNSIALNASRTENHSDFKLTGVMESLLVDKTLIPIQTVCVTLFSPKCQLKHYGTEATRCAAGILSWQIPACIFNSQHDLTRS